ncbi:glycosyltransferase family 39 protein [Dyadobacter sp. NIV53]|uniref:ArnT family glycosyltransferase n=1 Tax=Dyadobacter sp. NIV53 TaxID=2861765 RepID=UPI001C874B90|nr:glycosyltransferase family 39 protein [Dyadobacter sp. NIV53]
MTVSTSQSHQFSDHIKRNKPYSFYLQWLIVITTVIRCIVACYVELGNDEAYYFTYAVQPDWNHFDHPPMVGLFIRLFTLNLHWINDLAVRLPAILGAALNTWLIARCGLVVKNERTGFIAAVLYNTSIYTSIIAGLFILPDSVQLVFWLAALYHMLRLSTVSNQALQNKQILMLGVWIGLAIMCKVHGIFLWSGFLGYILFYKRSLLKNPCLYVSLLLTFLIISPILIWNFQNEFISWRFHSERVEVKNGINLALFLTTTLGQIAYNNPVNVCIFLITLAAIKKWKYLIHSHVLQILLWCSLPIIFCTVLVSIFRFTLPHWSGPGFLGLMLLSAAYIDFRMKSGTNLYTRLLKISATLIAVVIVAGTLLVNFYPGTLSTRPWPKTGSGDFTLDISGWEGLSDEFKKLRLNDIKTGRMSAETPIVTHKWFPGGHLLYYVAYPLKMRFTGIGQLNELHKFVWLNVIYGSPAIGSNAYFITSSDDFADPNILYGKIFQIIEKPYRTPQIRNGNVARYWYVYRLKNFTKK